MPKTHTGGCHCGHVRFRVTADLDRVTYCNCSICAKKGFLHLIVPPHDFEMLSGESELSTYTFNTGAAKHTFCKHCGIHPFIRPRLDPSRWAFNVRCIDGIDLSSMKVRSFDGENWEAAAKAYHDRLKKPPAS